MHLDVKCSFNRQVWIELEHLIKIKNYWLGSVVEESLRISFSDQELEHYRAFNHMLGNMAFQNIQLFRGQRYFYYLICLSRLGILIFFPWDKKNIKIR